MLKILLSGCCGAMGRAIEQLAAQSGGEFVIVGGIDPCDDGLRPYPVYRQAADFPGGADVAVDFSRPAGLPALLALCKDKRLPAVIATTGLSEADRALLAQAAQKLPVFSSANMSLGVNLLCELVQRAAAVLGCAYDIEIVEEHHSRKVDAPSGTALMLADSAASALAEQPDYVYERRSRRIPRPQNEIGIHSVRGGSIVGEHEVIFAGPQETLRLRHSAASRDVFAEGALRAALYLQGKGPGLYSMKDFVRDLEGGLA